jgi:hypothetical protein
MSELVNNFVVAFFRLLEIDSTGFATKAAEREFENPSSLG